MKRADPTRAEKLRQILKAMRQAGRDTEFMEKYLPTVTNERLEKVYEKWAVPPRVW